MKRDWQIAKGRWPCLVQMTTVPTTFSFLESLIKDAKEHGVEVHAISAPESELNSVGSRLQIPVHGLKMERRITPIKDLLSIYHLTRILSRIAPDIVHAHTPKGGLLGMIGSWLKGVPVRIYHIHGLPMMTKVGLKRGLLKWSERISCRLATQVYCVSTSVLNVVVKENICPAYKVKVLLNGTICGVDAEKKFNPSRFDESTRTAIRRNYNIPSDALVLGFVGRIVRDKGIGELYKAWQELRLEFPTLHMLLVGPFESQDPIPKEVELGLKADPRVHLAGAVAVEVMPQHYFCMDVFALPSYREGFNTALLEASAMQLPVITSSVPGCVDAVLDSETGVLVPSHSSSLLAIAIRTYLANDTNRIRHGENGRSRVLRDFQPKAMNEAILGEYQQQLWKCKKNEPRN